MRRRAAGFLNLSQSPVRPEREPHLASVLEHNIAAVREMRIELHPRQRSAQQAG
jgi:hypothetical protein